MYNTTYYSNKDETPIFEIGDEVEFEKSQYKGSALPRWNMDNQDEGPSGIWIRRQSYPVLATNILKWNIHVKIILVLAQLIFHTLKTNITFLINGNAKAIL